MKRRYLLAILGGIMWSFGLSAQQPAKPVIGFLSSATAESFTHLVAAFQLGLQEAGFVEGENVTIEYRWAEGHYERLPALAADLVSRQVAVLVASGGDRPTLAAQAATSTIPIVFCGSDDPVKFGLVDSLSHPGGNITGAGLFTSELEIKKFELLQELLPTAQRLGMLVNPDNPTAASDAHDIQAAATATGRQLTFVQARSTEEIDAAFATLAEQQLQGLLIGHDPFFNNQRQQIVAHVTRLGIPAVYEHRAFVLIGGLISYGNSIEENYRLAGDYVGRILQGARPADLPVRRATKFELVINLRTAAELDLAVPSSLLIRADDVIE